ncbi:FtsK/SpoIIIE domain-containing protein [Microbacterium sp. B2969]|uniref:FtsK/SpoIIIE domain-containing protein n=1 Tax=Microbacterium alkaliflavum TaxID=3248839 RepID=A0ABW7Q7Q2_9MICO
MPLPLAPGAAPFTAGDVSFADLVDEPLALPPERTPHGRPPVPILAMTVPLAGAVVLWLVTGSMLSLWLALLGPLIAGATLLDGLRASRRDGRKAAVDADAAHDRVGSAIDARHDRERARRRARHPDVNGFFAGEAEIWRPSPGRAEMIVVGSGSSPSGLQVTGGGADERSVALRRRARTVRDVPVCVPAAGGIAVVARPALAVAVSRALVLQACLASPPGELRIVGTLHPDDAWAEQLPHRRAATGTALAIVAAGDAWPPEAEAAIVRGDPAAPAPTGCAAVLTVASPGRARLDAGGEVVDLAVEGVSLAQALIAAERLEERASGLPGALAAAAPPVALTDLLSDAPSTGLAAVIGRENGAPAIVDLVADGPHAVVAGMTGTGKSELLITWVLALCATRSPREVSFLLADFKGGTAFDALADLPHVTGVITDLDGAGARRALESLRAEVRWREGELARAGARDILDPRVELPRLVVVVDEFAALLGDHPELHAVFTDIAARGRALGVHLVLGTQRVSGVVRDALLANCPLRVSLRVADAADSRAVIGSDEAAGLAGGEAGRGVALVRRAGDAVPRRVRVALSSPGDVLAAAATADGHLPRRPWLPDLPRRIDLAELPPAEGGGLILGLADEPDRQRQVPAAIMADDRGVLVVGAAGTGKSTALRTLAAQADRRIVVPADAEEAWDAVARLCDAPPPRGTLVVLDDLDALAARFPHDYAAELHDRLERVVRTAGDLGVFVAASAQRLTGAAGRIGELLPRRVVLGASTRSEYLALGGDAAHFSPDQPPGRARLGGRAVQIAVGPPLPATPETARAAWFPVDGVTGFAARRSPAARAALTAWEEAGARIARVGDEAVLSDLGEGPPGGADIRDRLVLVGDAEDWQRQWQTLTAVRSRHALVIDSSVAADFRALSADRALPPYCAPGRSRAWLCRDALPAARITLPPLDPGGAA